MAYKRILHHTLLTVLVAAFVVTCYALMFYPHPERWIAKAFVAWVVIISVYGAYTVYVDALTIIRFKKK